MSKLLTPEQKKQLLETYNKYGMIKTLKVFSDFSTEHKQYIKERITNYPKFGIKELQDLIEDVMESPLRFQHPLQGLAHSIGRTKDIYLQEIEESRKGMKGLGDTGLPKSIERVLSGLRYLTAPITAVTKAFIGEPVEQSLKLTGMKPEVAKTAGLIAEVALPVAGELTAAKAISKLPGITKQVSIAGKTFEYIPHEYAELFRGHKRMTNLAKEIGERSDKLKESGIDLNNIAKKIEMMYKLNKEQKEFIKSQKGHRLANFDEALKGVLQADNFTLDDLKTTFETLSGNYESIRKSHPLLKQALFSMDDIYKLSKYISSDTLNASVGDKISATKALVKSLSGELPYKSELDAIVRIFGKEFGKFLKEYSELLSQNPEIKGFSKVLREAVNLPRTIQASSDMSGLLRQGIVYMGRKEFWLNVKPYFKSMFTKDGYRSVVNSITSDKLFHEALRHKVQFTDIGALTGKEEMFMSSIATKIPMLGKLIEKSEQGYTAFLNKLRFDIYRNAYLRFAEKQSKGHITTAEFETIMHQLTRFINNATGRGETLFGVPLKNELAYFASNVFFAPRLMAGRVNTLFDVMKAITGAGGMHPLVRREILKDTAKSASMIGSLLGLSYLSGADINLNPTSSDFLKMKIGKARVDIFGGFQQYVVLASRLASEAYTVSSTDITRELNTAWGSPTSVDIIVRFASMKTSPFISFMIDLMTGRDFTGKNLDLATAVTTRFIPMIWHDAISMADAGLSPIETLAFTAAVYFGSGVAVYGVNDHYNEYYKNKDIKSLVDDKMALAGKHLQYVHSFKVYKGLELTDAQSQEYIKAFANVAYPILYSYLKDKSEHEATQMKVAEDVDKIKSRVKEYVGYELFGIPDSLVLNLTRYASQLIYNDIISKDPNISPRLLKKTIEKNVNEAVNDLIQEQILLYRELKEWVKQNQQ